MDLLGTSPRRYTTLQRGFMQESCLKQSSCAPHPIQAHTTLQPCATPNKPSDATPNHHIVGLNTPTNYFERAGSKPLAYGGDCTASGEPGCCCERSNTQSGLRNCSWAAAWAAASIQRLRACRQLLAGRWLHQDTRSHTPACGPACEWRPGRAAHERKCSVLAKCASVALSSGHWPCRSENIRQL